MQNFVSNLLFFFSIYLNVCNQTIRLINEQDVINTKQVYEGSFENTPSPWLTRIRFTRISLTRIFKKFPFLT